MKPIIKVTYERRQSSPADNIKIFAVTTWAGDPPPDQIAGIYLPEAPYCGPGKDRDRLIALLPAGSANLREAVEKHEMEMRKYADTVRDYLAAGAAKQAEADAISTPPEALL